MKRTIKRLKRRIKNLLPRSVLNALAMVQMFLVSWLGYFAVLFIYYTNKKKYIGLQHIASDQTVIIVFWHEHILMSAFHWKKLRRRQKNSRVSAVVSDHTDGEFITQIVKHLGIGAVRGSSTRGGAKALLSAIKELRDGGDVAFTPDGPKGPRHSVADGVVVAAKKSGLDIVPLGFTASNYWRLTSWDRFMIPKPFGTITFYSRGLISLEGLELNEAKQRIQKALQRA